MCAREFAETAHSRIAASKKYQENFDEIKILKFDEEYKVYRKCGNCLYETKIDTCKQCKQYGLWKYEGCD